MALEIIDLSKLPSSTQNFNLFLDQLCDRLGLDFASYAVVGSFSGAVQGYANYPEPWKQHYIRNNLHMVDPTLHKAVRSIAPVDWARFDRDDRFRSVFFPAGDYGIAPQGLTVPIRGPYGDRGLLSVTRACPGPEWEKLKREIIGDLQMAAVHMHDSVMSSSVLAGALGHSALSAREVEVLQWVAAGKMQQDIADILDISSRTVEVHLRSAREKLGALTTFQAVGRAIGLGLIFPS